MPAPASILPSTLVRNGSASQAPSAKALREALDTLVTELLGWATASPAPTLAFWDAEAWLIPKVFLLGRLLLALFLAVRAEEQAATHPPTCVVGGITMKRGAVQPRNLTTFFGIVRYTRLYLRGPKEGAHRSGFYPLDRALGLTTDRFSLRTLGLCARLAVEMSFADAHETLAMVLPEVPAVTQIEEAVLGLGSFAPRWFEQAPVPADDGEVLVAQFDSKGAPTATARELARRRQPRRRNPSQTPSQRHRGRESRERYGTLPRRAPGDKSKNARMATLVVMYTLRREGDRLVGPLNKRVYASFAKKEHAFQFARQQADRRGFGKDSGRKIQVLTDGENCFETYLDRYFPEAERTLDIVHAIEKLWRAAEVIVRERGEARAIWMAARKADLLGGREAAVVELLEQERGRIPKTGPGQKRRRARLAAVANYLRKRLSLMRYARLLDEDLELSTGAGEGAVRDILGRRFDQGGMRWIRERAEPLLQLRCIAANGEWDAFLAWVRQQLDAQAAPSRTTPTVLRRKPGPLPIVLKKAA
jgi:hypothetical protein